MPVTVHMIGNAHLDPVWLWGRAEGSDAALATARSACDRLDEYPAFVFTCSASWFHRQAERLDPRLFERIAAHVAAGRWRLVGGMVIQPDCNLPSAASVRKQLATGQAYYSRRFGLVTRVGYNVDSFGHDAYLPDLLAEAGLESYCFMRPGPGERELPARLFRWHGAGGAEVLAFRIAGAYCTPADELGDHVAASLADIPAGVEHTMCFFGVGDHGGGPTKRQIEWIRDHADAIDGATLRFSHPQAFFDAVAGERDRLPVVEGEIQHHAIGCYSVERRIKVGMRCAEAQLATAERCLELFGDAADETHRARLDAAWESLLFHEFHDILGGTSRFDASGRAAGELAAAAGQARDVSVELTRRATRADARPGEHRIVVVNASAEPFDGPIEHEPWQLPWPDLDGRRLIDEAGQALPFQEVAPSCMIHVRRMLLRLAVSPGERRMLRLVEGENPAPQPPGPSAGRGGSVRGGGIDARFVGEAVDVNGWTLRLDVHDDPTDTWTHCYDKPNRFDGERLGAMAWTGCEVVEPGPLRAAVRGAARFGDSRAWCRLAVCGGDAALHLRLRVVWAEARRRLALRITPPGGELICREDMVAGGPLARPLDGLEYPLAGALAARTADAALAVAAPLVFSASAGPAGVALTLLRSPYAAHHEPSPASDRPDHPVTDQGWHEFNLWFLPGAELAEAARRRDAFLAGPVVWDLTG